MGFMQVWVLCGYGFYVGMGQGFDGFTGYRNSHRSGIRVYRKAHTLVMLSR